MQIPTLPDPSRYVDLPDDVKLMVLNYVTRTSDLKVACLISKSWNAVATPRLYKDIILDIQSRHHVVKFMKCIGQGASLHLKAARSLTLLDSLSPVESVLVRLSHPQRWPEWDASERNHSLSMILELFPENVLHTFRHLSSSHLDYTCFAALRSSQRLKHVHLTVPQTTAMNIIPATSLSNSQLHTLDIHFTEHDGRNGKFFYVLMNQIPGLKRLSLGSDDPIKLSDDWKNALSSQRIPCRQRALQELSLHGMYLKDMFSSFTQTFDFTQLKRFTLWNCDYSDSFLIGIGSNLLDISLSLEHFVYSSTSTCGDDGETNTAFARIFQSSKSLSSVHLSWPEMRRDEDANIVTALAPLLHSLRSLSLHDSTIMPLDYADSYEVFRANLLVDWELSWMCSQFKYVQQLGIHVAELLWLAPAEELHKICSELDSLKQLTDLRILHLRQSKLFTSNLNDGDASSEEQLALTIQKFASAFFQSLDKNDVCPKLNVFVWGMYGDPTAEEVRELCDNQIGEDERITRVRQHYFFKGQQVVRGQITTIAVPVTRVQLRNMEPDLDILDYDPGCTWQGRHPRRFHD